TRPGVSDSPEAADSARGSDSLARLEARRERWREAAATRRRRRRRLLFAMPPPRPALLGHRLVRDLDAGADEHALRGAQRRVGGGQDAVRQLAGRRDRAHLLQRERTEEGRIDAEEPAGSGAEPAAAQEGRRRLASADQAGLRPPAAWRRDLETDRAVDRRQPTGAGDDLPSRSRISGASR